MSADSERVAKRQVHAVYIAHLNGRRAHRVMDMTLKGGTAVITGAAHGIGAALAVALAERGCHLALVDRDAAALDALLVRLRALPVHASAHVVDLADKASVAQLPIAVSQQHGAVTILVNNAGVALLGDFEEVSLEDLEWLIDINFWGVVRTTKAFLPLLRRARSAHIVNVSSLFGLIAPPGQAGYCASKFAVRGFSEALAAELTGSGIRVTTVHPGGIRTAIAERARQGAQTPLASARRAREDFARLANTTAAAAALKIVAAIESRQPRLLIGSDARLGDLLQRVSPLGYGKALRWIVASRLGSKRTAAALARPAPPD